MGTEKGWRASLSTCAGEGDALLQRRIIWLGRNGRHCFTGRTSSMDSTSILLYVYRQRMYLRFPMCSTT
jgi:hypothetical protein